MHKIIDFEYILRVLSSVAFRALILLYGLYIILFYDNTINGLYYIIIFPVYLFIYFSLLKYDDYRSRLRLLNDFLFILIIIYGKPINYPDIIIFLLLPIFNTHNYTGKKRSLMLYLFTLIVYFICYNNPSAFKILLPIVALFLISLFELLRSREVRFFWEIVNTPDKLAYNLLESESNLTVIFGNTKRVLDDSSFSKLFKVDNIMYVKILDSHIEIFSAYNPIRSLTLPEVVFAELNNKYANQDYIYILKGVTSDTINLDGFLVKFMNSNDGFIVTGEFRKHFFNVETNLQHKVFSSIMHPLFKKIKNMIDAKSALLKQRLIVNNTLKKEISYILRAHSAMHFIKNRLSPLTSTLGIIQELKDFSKFEEQKREALSKVYSDLAAMTLPAINEILSRTDEILKSPNPYDISGTKPYLRSNLIAVLRNILIQFYQSVDCLEIEQNLTLNSEVKYNERGIEIMFSDIIRNQQKYNAGKFAIKLRNGTNSFYIDFINNTNLTEGQSNELLAVVNNLNSTENHGVLRIKNKGIYIIKDFAYQMGIEVSASFKDNLFQISLKLNDV